MKKYETLDGKAIKQHEGGWVEIGNGSLSPKNLEALAEAGWIRERKMKSHELESKLGWPTAFGLLHLILGAGLEDQIIAQYEKLSHE